MSGNSYNRRQNKRHQKDTPENDAPEYIDTDLGGGVHFIGDPEILAELDAGIVKRAERKRNLLAVAAAAIIAALIYLVFFTG